MGEFQAWFRTDADCLDYLEWLRWPAGFVCAECGHDRGWRLGDGRYRCSGCGGRTSVTAGTVFDRTRTPLTVWFTACWLFATSKDGVSALSLQRTLEIGSYQTAWAMLQRLRSVLVRPGRDRLAGVVEVDETYIGGEEPGLAGGRARGKKVLTGIAVEIQAPNGVGRDRRRRCCRIDRSGGAFRSGEPSPTDAVGRGPTEFGHPIQHVAREERLGLSSGFRAGSQTRSDDRLVPKDHVLHACLPRVSGGFLPPPTAEYLHASDRPIASTGPRAVPRQRRGSRRRHHDPRVSGAGAA